MFHGPEVELHLRRELFTGKPFPYRSMPFRPQLGHWIGSGRGAPGTGNTVWHAGHRILTGGGGGGSGFPFLPFVTGCVEGCAAG